MSVLANENEKLQEPTGVVTESKIVCEVKRGSVKDAALHPALAKWQEMLYRRNVSINKPGDHYNNVRKIRGKENCWDITPLPL